MTTIGERTPTPQETLEVRELIVDPSILKRYYIEKLAADVTATPDFPAPEVLEDSSSFSSTTYDFFDIDVGRRVTRTSLVWYNLLDEGRLRTVTVNLDWLTSRREKYDLPRVTAVDFTPRRDNGPPGVKRFDSNRPRKLNTMGFFTMIGHANHVLGHKP